MTPRLPCLREAEPSGVERPSGTGRVADAERQTDSPLHRALQRGELVLHYQPQFGTDDLSLRGVEALVRRLDPRLGLQLPGSFLDIGSDGDDMLALDTWVLETACAQMRAWQGAGHAPARIAVNVSGAVFKRGDLLALVQRCLQDTGLAPSCLELELSEGTKLDLQQVAPVLSALHALGVRLSIDDFGTGHATLAYLDAFELDALKIDRRFIDRIAQRPRLQVITDTLIVLGERLALETLAEGVETVEQYQYLRSRGCQSVQGWLFGRAEPPERLSQLLRDGVMRR